MGRVFVERRELPDDLRRLLDVTATAAEYTPPLDIIETEHGVEILLDLPGVPASQVEIAFSRNVLLIAGEKPAAACADGDAAFHIAERAFGRFARAVGLEGAFNVGKASATLTHGELRVVLPRLAERRGGHIRIPIS